MHTDYNKEPSPDEMERSLAAQIEEIISDPLLYTADPKHPIHDSFLKSNDDIITIDVIGERQICGMAYPVMGSNIRSITATLAWFDINRKKRAGIILIVDIAKGDKRTFFYNPYEPFVYGFPLIQGKLCEITRDTFLAKFVVPNVPPVGAECMTDSATFWKVVYGTKKLFL